MAWSLTLEQRRKLRSLYINVGATKDGVVLLGDLEQLFREQTTIPAAELASVMAALRLLDADGDQELHYSDFLAGMMAKKLEKDEACGTLLQDTFRRFEVQGQGYITPESVKVLAGDVPDQELDEAFNQAHLRHKGRMDINEFVAYIRGNMSSRSLVAPSTSCSARFNKFSQYFTSCMGIPQAKGGSYAMAGA